MNTEIESPIIKMSRWRIIGSIIIVLVLLLISFALIGYGLINKNWIGLLGLVPGLVVVLIGIYYTKKS